MRLKLRNAVLLVDDRLDDVLARCAVCRIGDHFQQALRCDLGHFAARGENRGDGRWGQRGNQLIEADERDITAGDKSEESMHARTAPVQSSSLQHTMAVGGSGMVIISRVWV